MNLVSQAAILSAAHTIAQLNAISSNVTQQPLYQAGLFGVAAPSGSDATARLMAAGTLHRRELEQLARTSAQQRGAAGALGEVAASMALPESLAIGGAVGELPRYGRIAATAYFAASQASNVAQRMQRGDVAGSAVIALSISLPALLNMFGRRSASARATAELLSREDGSGLGVERSFAFRVQGGTPPKKS